MSKISVLIVEDEGMVAYDLASTVRQLVLMDIQLRDAMAGITAAQQI